MRRRLLFIDFQRPGRVAEPHNLSLAFCEGFRRASTRAPGAEKCTEVNCAGLKPGPVLRSARLSEVGVMGGTATESMLERPQEVPRVEACHCRHCDRSEALFAEASRLLCGAWPVLISLRIGGSLSRSSFCWPGAVCGIVTEGEVPHAAQAGPGLE